MKVRTWVRHETEVDVEVLMEDVIEAMAGDPDKRLDVRMMDVISTLARFFRLIPDDMIAKLHQESRDRIAEFLRGQVERFEAQP